MPKTKSTVYFTKITTLKTGKYLKFSERKTPGQVLACLLACLPWVSHEFTKNVFAIFDQSSPIILLLWYCRLYSSPWIPLGYPLNGSVKDFLSNHRGVNIIQFCSNSVSLAVFFILFQSLGVRAWENLSATWVFQLDLL